MASVSGLVFIEGFFPELANFVAFPSKIAILSTKVKYQEFSEEKIREFVSYIKNVIKIQTKDAMEICPKKDNCVVSRSSWFNPWSPITESNFFVFRFEHRCATFQIKIHSGLRPRFGLCQ